MLSNDEAKGLDVEANHRIHGSTIVDDESKRMSECRLVIHGESIGGMASAFAAKVLSTEDNRLINANQILLICDRTFCNLIAVARKMVGEWTRIFIPYLVPDWCTDVAADFKNASCSKIGEILDRVRLIYFDVFS